jgi:NADPH-dependent F420 reductase
LDAAKCEIVIIATPWESTLETLQPLAGELADKILVSMVNAMQKEGREMRPIFPAAGSCAQEIAALLPNARVVTAFNHLPAGQMEDLDSGLDADVILCGADNESMAEVAEMVSAMPGLHAIEAGSLALAGTIEAFTSVCISVNIRNKAHSYVKLEGLSH